MSLSFQVEELSSLSPGSTPPTRVPRRTSARRNRATVGVAEVLVIVTLVTRPAPSGPLCREVTARAWTVAAGSEFRARRFAYDDILACGLPRVFGQFGTSGWVDSQ